MSKIDMYKNKMYNLSDIAKNSTNSILEVYNIMENDKKTYLEAVEQYCTEMKNHILNDDGCELELLLLLLANNSDNINKDKIIDLVTKIIIEDKPSLSKLLNDNIILLINIIKEIEENNSNLSTNLITLLKTKKVKREILDKLTFDEKEIVINTLGTEVFIDDEINNFIKNILINKIDFNDKSKANDAIEENNGRGDILKSLFRSVLCNLALYDINENTCSVLSLFDLYDESLVILIMNYIKEMKLTDSDCDVDIKQFKILLSNLSIILSDEEMDALFSSIIDEINPKRYKLEMELILLGKHEYNTQYRIHFDGNYSSYKIIRKYTNNKSFIDYYKSNIPISLRIIYNIKFKLNH